MKPVLSHLAILSSVFLGASAMAAPFGGADCVTFSNANMTGQTQVISHNSRADERRIAVPAFTPKSIYLANGYAARIYAQANFGGEVALLADAGQLAGDLAFYNIRTTEGGHYLNLDEVWPGGPVAAFSCVDAGEKVSLPEGSWRKSFVAYNNEAFGIDQFQNIHGNEYRITVTYLNGKALVTVKSRQIDSQSGTDAVLDLASGDITVTDIYPNNVPMTSHLAKHPAASYTRDLAYIGAIKIMLEPINNSLRNNQGSMPTTGFFPEANPELAEVSALLGDYDFHM